MSLLGGGRGRFHELCRPFLLCQRCRCMRRRQRAGLGETGGRRGGGGVTGGSGGIHRHTSHLRKRNEIERWHSESCRRSWMFLEQVWEGKVVRALVRDTMMSCGCTDCLSASSTRDVIWSHIYLWNCWLPRHHCHRDTPVPPLPPPLQLHMSHRVAGSWQARATVCS